MLFRRGAILTSCVRPPKDHLAVYTDASVRPPLVCKAATTTLKLPSKRIGLGVWCNDESLTLAGRVIRSPSDDINVAELLAILTAVSLSDDARPLALHTDSAASLHMLRQTGRIKPKYRAIVGEIRDQIRLRSEYTWLYKVKAHSGIYGNERADQLSRVGTNLLQGVSVHLLQGVSVILHDQANSI